MIKDLNALPANLPVPVDDGACDHLLGMALPAISLTSTSGKAVDLSRQAGTVVLYFYPMLGRPDSPPLIGWNDIPGARGCTPQTCAFRDSYAALKSLGVEVFGVSAQPFEDQQEARARLQLPFELLNDEQLICAKALKVPTFEYAGRRLIKRLTLIVTGGLVRKVFYPVFPPNENVHDVVVWLKASTGQRERPNPTESTMPLEDRTMRTSRILPFSTKVVYGAFASPDLLALWWGPDGFTNTFEVFEFKVGGQWKFVMHGPDGQSYQNECVFAQLEPGSKIVIDHVCAPHFTLTVELAAESGGTKVSWEQVFADAKIAQAVKRIVGPANEQNLDRLTQVLTSASAA